MINNCDAQLWNFVFVKQVLFSSSDANFVSSFEYKDNFVYFFLREAAVEKGKVCSLSS